MKSDTLFRTLIRGIRPIITVLLLFGVSGVRLSADPLYMWYTSLGDAEMYLLGSIHVLSEDFYPLPDVIDNLSYSTDLLVLEADIREDAINSAEINRLTLKYGIYHDGSRLENHIPEKMYQHLGKIVRKLGFTMEIVSSMKPWLLSLTLQLLELQTLGYKTEYGMEQVFTDRHGDGELVELEGAAFQLELLSGLSDEEQLELLNSTLEEFGSMTESVNRIVNAWRNGDPDMIADILVDDITEHLIIERNIAMAEKAGTLLREFDGTILLMVGAAHFIGDTSIPALMLNQGFNISQVSSDGDLLPFTLSSH